MYVKAENLISVLRFDILMKEKKIRLLEGEKVTSDKQTNVVVTTGFRPMKIVQI